MGSTANAEASYTLKTNVSPHKAGSISMSAAGEGKTEDILYRAGIETPRHDF